MLCCKRAIGRSRYHLGLPRPRGRRPLRVRTRKFFVSPCRYPAFGNGGIPGLSLLERAKRALRSGGGCLRVFAGVPGCLAPSGSSLAGALGRKRARLSVTSSQSWPLLCSISMQYKEQIIYCQAKRIAVVSHYGRKRTPFWNFMWRKVHEMFFAQSICGLYNGCVTLVGLCDGEHARFRMEEVDRWYAKNAARITPKT